MAAMMAAAARPRSCVPALGGRGSRGGVHPRPAGTRAGKIDTSLGGDLGARDPHAEELASNFADKVQGNPDTEHIIKPPERINELVGLATKACVPCAEGAEPLARSEADALARQAGIGWNVVEADDGSLRVRSTYTLRNFEAGLEMCRRIGEVAEAENHHPDLHLEQWNQLTVEIFTHKINGLTESDFVLAAKVERIDIADLLPKKKKKFWA